MFLKLVFRSYPWKKELKQLFKVTETLYLYSSTSHVMLVMKHCICKEPLLLECLLSVVVCNKIQEVMVIAKKAGLVCFCFFFFEAVCIF